MSTTLTREEIREAMALPGFRWMPGMLTIREAGDPAWRVSGHVFSPCPGPTCTLTADDRPEYTLPMRREPHAEIDPSDPATVGCLLELLGRGVDTCSCGGAWDVTIVDRDVTGSSTESLGAACIRAALARGEWPGGVTP